MTQAQVRRPEPQKREEAPAGSAKAPDRASEAELKEKLDDLLDEVDTILNEEGVEQLVNFKQSGGQQVWGLYGFAEGNWTPKPPDPLGSGRERSYNCRACQVHGKGLDDGTLTCWCCDSADHLDIDKTVAILNAHTWAAREADGDTFEAVGSLVGQRRPQMKGRT